MLCRFALRAIALALIVCSSPALALVIRGDSSWLENPECPPRWERIDTNDSRWQPIDFPWLHIVPQYFPFDPDARPFWGNGPYQTNCLRRRFLLDALPNAPTRLAIWVDDDYDVYLNNIFVGSSHDHAGLLPGETYDVGSQLRLGLNVLALRVTDTGGATGAIVSLSLPGVPDPCETWAEWGTRVAPWLEGGAVVLSAVLLGAMVRSLGVALRPRLLSLGSPRLAVALVAAAGLCQWLMSGHELYRGLRDIPIVSWSWEWLLPTIAALALLIVLAASISGDGGGETSTPSGRGHWLTLGLVVVLALLLRSLWIDSIPVGFYQDEATNGNDALRIGDSDVIVLWSENLGGRPTLFLYSVLAVFKLLGASYLSLKVAPIAFGCATVVAVYALGRVAFGARVALWAALVLAVSRWHVHFSRQAWEAICVPFFGTGGLALLLHGLQSARLSALWLAAGGALLAGGLYTYASYRAIPVVAVVFLLSALDASHRTQLRRRWPGLLLAGFAAAVVSAPLIHFAINFPDLYWFRVNEVSLIDYIAYFGTPLPLFHQLGRSLLSLNNVGDEIVRHNLPWAPQLDPLTGVLFMIGLAIAAWRWSALGYRLTLLWFLVFGLLAALTRDGPHATRLLGLIVPVSLLAGVAIVTILDALHGAGYRVRGLALALCLALTLTNAYQYFVREAHDESADFEYNLLGRSVCELLRAHQAADVYWTDDVSFYADAPCQFLTHGHNRILSPLSLADLGLGGRLHDVRVETLVILGREFVERHHSQLQAEPGKPLSVALPVAPQIVTDRRGEPLYYLYRLGGGSS